MPVPSGEGVPSPLTGRSEALVLWEPGAGRAPPAVAAGVPCVRLKWLWDTAASFQCQSYAPYA